MATIDYSFNWMYLLREYQEIKRKKIEQNWSASPPREQILYCDSNLENPRNFPSVCFRSCEFYLKPRCVVRLLSVYTFIQFYTKNILANDHRLNPNCCTRNRYFRCFFFIGISEIVRIPRRLSSDESFVVHHHPSSCSGCTVSNV